MVGPPPERVGAEVQGWSCSEVLGSRAGLVFFDVLFNYEARSCPCTMPSSTTGLVFEQQLVLMSSRSLVQVLLRYERHATATGGQPYIVCAMSA